MASRGAMSEDLGRAILASYQPFLLPGAMMERVGPKSIKIQSAQGVTFHRAFAVSRFRRLSPKAVAVCVWEIAAATVRGVDRHAYVWAARDGALAVVSVDYGNDRIATRIEWPNGDAVDLDAIDFKTNGRPGHLMGAPGSQRWTSST